MDINDRKEKIKLLQLKNNRNNLIKELKTKDIHLTLNSFLDPQYSRDLIINLYNEIDKLGKNKEEFKFEHSSVKAVNELDLLYSKIPKQLQEKEVILFHLNYFETGAIVLRFGDIFRDINWIVNFSGYNDTFDFIVFELTFNFGVCIERFEYWDTFTNWGLFN
ncbi:hypothetical protein V7148_19815 [Gottfriedia acidiceleris]|uniref:YxiF family protein n=1 Tax=Bacillaceae TaxID=186817 RepID=UPI000BEB99F1|nr:MULTISPECIES: hypothetical protein [unclassified Bacillus (in: firmicutes)]PEC51319.1 hypothetical protein CON00_03190 [Bacillus sp. AFS096315]PFM83351.1 hypothetical protein COJ46_00575 [Bacillus sp. AFS077874]